MYTRGRSLMEKGQYQDAALCFQQSAELMPHFKTYELLGECWLKLADYPKALVNLAAAATLGNRQSRPLYLLAQALVGSGDKEKAIEILDKALAVNPQYASAKKLRENLAPGS